MKQQTAENLTLSSVSKFHAMGQGCHMHGLPAKLWATMRSNVARAEVKDDREVNRY